MTHVSHSMRIHPDANVDVAMVEYDPDAYDLDSQATTPSTSGSHIAVRFSYASGRPKKRATRSVP